MLISEIPVGHKVKISELINSNCQICIKPILFFLQGLGVVIISNDSVELKSITAFLFIKSFIEYITNDLSILSGWEDQKGRPITINEHNILLSEAFLFCMEKKRADLLGNNANIIKLYDISRVVFKARINNKDCYLMQYGSKSNRYSLVGGGVEPSDRNSYAAIIREISEELPEADLEIGVNYKLKEIYKSKQSEKSMSNKYGVYTGYNITVFLAYDVDHRKLNKLDTKINIWVSEKEIKNRVANDGKLIFPIGDELLDALRTSSRSFNTSEYKLWEMLFDHRIEIILSILVSVLGIIAYILKF
jgi:hypothetical protein